MRRGFGEPKQDPRVGEALRARGGGQSGAGDEELRLRILQSALPRLARLREGPRPWWQWMAAWARVAVPVGLAASLAAGALLVQGTGSSDQALDSTDTETARSVVVGLATGRTAEPQIADELVAQPSDEWLLARVMSE
jgi:hypothetical protein